MFVPTLATCSCLHLLTRQRETLTLIISMGLTFEEAATIMNVALETAKSRVIHIRIRLTSILFLDSEDQIDPNGQTLAALQF